MVYIGVIHPYHLSTCLLFTNAKKNVLCEKPLAMNTSEVQKILASAKTNDVFLMEVGMNLTRKNIQTVPVYMNSPVCMKLCEMPPVLCLKAVWTRFFPASVEIRRLLAQGEVGEVKLVRSEFGLPVNHVARSVQRDLGGGAMLDLGIYCLQFICMVFNREKPECIQATGVCLETGNEKDRPEGSRRYEL